MSRRGEKEKWNGSMKYLIGGVMVGATAGFVASKLLAPSSAGTASKVPLSESSSQYSQDDNIYNSNYLSKYTQSKYTVRSKSASRYENCTNNKPLAVVKPEKRLNSNRKHGPRELTTIKNDNIHVSNTRRNTNEPFYNSPNRSAHSSTIKKPNSSLSRSYDLPANEERNKEEKQSYASLPSSSLSNETNSLIFTNTNSSTKDYKDDQSCFIKQEDTQGYIEELAKDSINYSNLATCNTIIDFCDESDESKSILAHIEEYSETDLISSTKLWM